MYVSARRSQPRKNAERITIRKEVIEINTEGIKVLKKKMIDFGRDDFTNYLAELLYITPAAASNKLNGKSKFDQEEITILTMRLGLSAEEIKQIFILRSD